MPLETFSQGTSQPGNWLTSYENEANRPGDVNVEKGIFVNFLDVGQ